MLAAANNRVALAVADSGAYKTIMDMRVAADLGLQVRKAVNGNCGKYGVPGAGIDHDYAGIVEQPFELRLGERVRFTLTGMRVITHPFPLFLIGADILCGGKPSPSWNYTGFHITTGANGKVTGTVGFQRGAEEE